MKLLLTALIVLPAFFCFGQQKKMNIYFLKNSGKYVDNRDSADYVRIVSEPDSGSSFFNVAEYYSDGKKKLLGLSSKIDPPVFEGQCASYYKNGLRQSLSNYKNGLPVGNQYQFYPNGKAYEVRQYPDNGNRYNDIDNNYLIEAEYDSLGTPWVADGNGYYKMLDKTFKLVFEEGKIKNGKRDSVWRGYYPKINTRFTETYKDGLLIEGTATYDDGATGKYYKTRGTPPQFKGGLDAFGTYLGKSIRYPTEEREKNIQGRVILSFVVEKDGKVTEIKVSKSVSPNIDDEAVRVLKNSPPWIPGTQFGRPVRVQYSIPINFALRE